MRCSPGPRRIGQHDRPGVQGDVDGEGLPEGYNTQAATNEEQLIVAASVTDEQSDVRQLHPMIEATKTSLAERVDRKVSNEAGHAPYRKRQQIIEWVFGQIEDGRRIRGSTRRGTVAAASEWQLICGTHNLSKRYRRALGDAAAAPYSRIATALER